MQWVIFITTALAGLLVGSFLNVVIYRGPALWGLLGDDRRARGSLAGPRSACPACGARIAVVDLIPVANYLWLRGKCRRCGASIPARYPLVELLSAGAALASVMIYGVTLSALLAAVFLLSLIALAAIDFETGYLPNALTLPLIVIGIAANYGGRFASFNEALIGAAAGFAAFWLIGALYRLVRKREGLGVGDAKLLAALGAWCGWAALPAVTLFASLFALAGVLSIRLRGKTLAANTPVRFGPALCAAGAAVFLIIALTRFA